MTSLNISINVTDLQFNECSNQYMNFNVHDKRITKENDSQEYIQSDMGKSSKKNPKLTSDICVEFQWAEHRYTENVIEIYVKWYRIRETTSNGWGLNPKFP